MLGAKKPELVENGLKLKGSLISKIVGKTLLRIPILSFGFLSLLEILSIIREKNHSKQAVKSSISVTSLVLGSAVGGAILSMIHPSLGLVGLGIGSYFASKASKKINDYLS